MNFDFRYADEEDAEGIAALLNSAYAIEKGDSGEAFKLGDCTTAAEVPSRTHPRSSTHLTSFRWQVLADIENDTRMYYLAEDAKDTLVSCACMSSDSEARELTVQLLAVAPALQGKGEPPRNHHSLMFPLARANPPE